MYAVVLTYRQITTETNQLVSCRRRATDTIDRRFCFDVTLGTSDKNSTLTLQALSDDDMQAWLQAMDGKEPVTPADSCHRLLYRFSSRCSVWMLHFVSFLASGQNKFSNSMAALLVISSGLDYPIGPLGTRYTIF